MKNRSLNHFLFLAISLLVFLTASMLVAATLPAGFTEALVANGIPSPTAMAFAPDGRLFVCQQNGQLRVIKNGSLLATNFVSVTTDPSGERGLLGVAFDPNFAANHYVYIYYTVPGSPAHNRVSRFTANGDVAVAGSEQVILELNNLSDATNHNGGGLHFGGDGKLYISVGENANSANSQSLSNLLGKVLRINPDGTIPSNNPFYGSALGINRAIWAMGLRNPFTFDVQPGSGRIFINDVGQSTTEEINDGIAGANYGWPNCEGNCSPVNPSYVNPIYQYSHAGACAITGGTFYNPPVNQFPAGYAGNYFFADYCGGWIRKLDPANGNLVTGFGTGFSSPVDLKVGSDGSLYTLERGRGVIKIQFTGSPSITSHPQDQTVDVGAPATFTVGASGTQPLNYQWQRNLANISGANATSYTIAAAAQSDDGAQFRCIVGNVYGSATSNPAMLIIANNNPPTATIDSPTNGSFYQAGDTINFSGSGYDPEDGNLVATAFSWIVEFHHDTHIHPFMGPTNGIASGSFQIPVLGETSTNVYYRIWLTVTDSGGRQGGAFVDIVPRTATITLQTSPAGLKVTLDGQPVTTPYSAGSVVGMTRTLGVVSGQKFDKNPYDFSTWSDGGAATHTISTPAINTTYTATFKRRGKK